MTAAKIFFWNFILELNTSVRPNCQVPTLLDSRADGPTLVLAKVVGRLVFETVQSAHTLLLDIVSAFKGTHFYILFDNAFTITAVHLMKKEGKHKTI